MAKAFINLTLLVPIEEIDTFLSNHPNPFQQNLPFMCEIYPKLCNSQLRQKLLNHVISHMPHHYAVIDCIQECSAKPKMPYKDLAEKLRVEILIQDGIFQILPDCAEKSELGSY